MTALTAIAL